jgi:hypothetical protein
LKSLKLFLGIFFLALLARAQPPQRIIFVKSAPSGSCSPNSQALRYVFTGASAGNLYACDSTWQLLSTISGSGTVTSIVFSAPLTGGTITTSGTVTCPTASASQAGCLSTANWSTFNGKGPTTNQNIRDIPIVFDGGGSALSGTISRCRVVDFAGSIVGVSLLADQSGSATVDILTVTYASYTGAASASSITASDTPALSTAVKYQDTTLTGWTTTLAAGTVVCGKMTSPTTVTWLEMTLEVAAN